MGKIRHAAGVQMGDATPAPRQVSFMRVDRLIVGGVTATLFAFAVCYALWRNAAAGSVDWAGVIMLGLGGAVCAAMELCLAVVARMIESRSGSETHAERADANSESGPSGYGPIAVAAAATAIGFVHQALWLIAAGVAAVVLATSGLLLRRSAGTCVR
jgi:hypothetical protein